MFIYSVSDANLDHDLFSREALLSAYSLRRFTDKPIALFTDRPDFAEVLNDLTWSPFSDIKIVAPCVHPKLAKVRAINSVGFENCVFLDSDTIIFDDLSLTFQIDDFDIAAVPAPARNGVISLDPGKEGKRIWNLNSGVFFFRRSRVKNILYEWEDHLADRVARNTGDARSIMDQGSLFAVLAKHKPKTLFLPEVFNWRAQMGGRVSGKLFVLHAHVFKKRLAVPLGEFLNPGFITQLLDIADTVNASTETVVFPKLDQIEENSLARGRVMNWPPFEPDTLA